MFDRLVAYVIELEQVARWLQVDALYVLELVLGNELVLVSHAFSPLGPASKHNLARVGDFQAFAA